MIIILVLIIVVVIYIIYIYDSVVVHSQYTAQISNTYTNRKRTQKVFPAINRILAQRLEAGAIPQSHTQQTHRSLS